MVEAGAPPCGDMREKGWHRLLRYGAVQKLLPAVRLLLIGLLRRQAWLLENLTIRKTVNMAVASGQFLLKSRKVAARPVFVKIDVTPLCNLSCTACVHADPNGNPALEKQEFKARQRMPLDEYRRIIDQIKGHTSAVSLYFLGDPLLHPNVDEMCRMARDAGLNVHISTNFSFSLTDERIRRLVRSGLTHMTVCVDGLSQEKYQRTRVGGRIDRVLSNLSRVCRFRREYHQPHPRIEVQYLKFQHNLDEVEPARRLFEHMGIDQVTEFWGGLENYTDFNPGNYTVFGPKRNRCIPQCFWAHAGMVVKFDGDVIPCCNYRTGEQYTATDDPKALGNVFQTSLLEVWNSPPYQDVRRIVSNPRIVESEPAFLENFCYGCPILFETDISKQFRSGRRYTFEELYTIGPEGRSVRRRTPPA